MMKAKKKILHYALAATIGGLTFVPLSGLRAQSRDKVEAVDPATKETLRQKVIANFDSLSYHKEFIQAMGIDNPELEAQYQSWMTEHPKNANIPYALGQAFERRESPKAKDYLLKAVDINPGFTEAWGGLWIDAERWGENELGRDYLKKATESDPNNADFAFYYASSFSGVDETKYRDLSLKVAEKYNDKERGAQALYWLAVRSDDPTFKEEIFKQLRKQFSPTTFRWSSSGMGEYFSFLAKEGRWDEAQRLAMDLQETAEDDDWKDNVKSAQQAIDIKKALTDKDGKEALVLLDSVGTVSRYSPLRGQIPFFRAEALTLSGKATEAFEQLVSFYIENPSPKVKKEIMRYGKAIDKNENAVELDIKKALNTKAVPATPFSLKNYEGGTTALSDYKGKVVLLTYWFPGCGPCRGEFPHFQNVVSKFSKDELAYVGINIVSEQNDYVLPFLKGTKYTFFPLEDVKDRDRGNLDNRGAAPVNFLIDKEGRVVFSNFRTDNRNEDELELMINELLSL